MLGTIRKFSTSIFAKIFLFIVAIPFVFWGMGPLFSGGNLKTIVKIDKNKVPTQEFIEYIKIYSPPGQKITTALVDNLFSNFIGEKLITEEINDLKIELSDISLSDLIKNQKIFKENNEFSRVEYEKFLVKNSLNAIIFESRISREEKKRQLLDFIGGGLVPPQFMVNLAFDKINQKRFVQFINLNDLFKKKINITQEQINTYFDKNKESF